MEARGGRPSWIVTFETARFGARTNKNAGTLLANFPAGAANIDVVPQPLEVMAVLGSLDFINDSDGGAAVSRRGQRLASKTNRERFRDL